MPYFNSGRDIKAFCIFLLEKLWILRSINSPYDGRKVVNNTVRLATRPRR